MSEQLNNSCLAPVLFPEASEARNCFKDYRENKASKENGDPLTVSSALKLFVPPTLLSLV